MSKQELDPMLQMYEALAIVKEKEEVIEQLKKEKDDAIQRLTFEKDLIYRQVIQLMKEKEDHKIMQTLSYEVKDLKTEMDIFKQRLLDKNAESIASTETKLREEFDKKIAENMEAIKSSEVRIEEKFDKKLETEKMELEDFAFAMKLELQEQIDETKQESSQNAENLSDVQESQLILLIKQMKFQDKTEAQIAQLQTVSMLDIIRQSVIDMNADDARSNIKEEVQQLLDRNQEDISSVLILGGVGQGVTDDIYIFSPTTNKFHLLTLKLPARVCGIGAVVSDDIYISGTYNNSNKESWNTKCNTLEEKTGISNSYLIFQNEIWIIGGFNKEGRATRTVEKCSTAGNKVTRMADLIEARAYAAATEMNGKLYVSGGMNGKQYLKSIEVYDPATEKWNFFYDMPFRITSHCMLSMKNVLILIGGLTSFEVSDKIWTLNIEDLEKMEWELLTKFKNARHCFGAFILNNMLYIFGGLDENNRRLDSIEIYADNKWIKGRKLPTPMSDFAYTTITRKMEMHFLELF